MIINANSSLYSNASPAPVRHGKSHSADSTPSAIDDTADQLSVTQENLNAASPLTNVDAAIATLQSARQNILGQPSQAMMAQASSSLRNALQLLQD